MTEKRTEKFKEVVKKRQSNLTVILENVHDLHNIGAVLRTCDSVGIGEIFILNTDPKLKDQEYLHLAARSSSGARKWINVNFYTEIKPCFEHVRKQFDSIFCTHLGGDTQSLYDLDLTQSVALLFGNEHEGVSEEALSYCDGNFLIPQVGMVQSLNISVACAVSIYEAMRQRMLKGFYDNNPTLSESEQAILLNDYMRRHELKIKNKSVRKLNH
ncbi:MAG TPA: RNA methyltransferase [Phaeodactylibacter sp.]|nr:RNA methyltransferase [Phaeodactylibacter sp.]